MRLPDLIARTRKEKKLSKRELARRVGVAPTTIARIESGETIPRGDNLSKLGAVLGIDPKTLDAAMREGGVTPTIRERRTPYEITRELQAALEEAPILVPESAQPASAGPGAFAEAEQWAYWPTAEERRHQFVTVPVVGNCMVPRLHDGERVIVDKDASPKPGDIVVAIHDGETLIKQLEKRNGELWLVALRERKPIKVDESTRIIGVIRMVMRRP